MALAPPHRHRPKPGIPLARCRRDLWVHISIDRPLGRRPACILSLATTDFHVERQPDDMTCGPTCLHAVYAHFGDVVPLPELTAGVPQLEHGGTYAPLLGVHALRRGYAATIHTCDLDLFDPTWFDSEVDLKACLLAQAKAKPRKKLRVATQAYIDFLDHGGRVRLQPLTGDLLRRYLRRGIPVLTGLSATYLYWCARERTTGPSHSVYDDIRGEPAGHFVVIYRYDPDKQEMWLADPIHDNPRTGTMTYAVPTAQVISAILLGATTYDASILVVEPRPEGGS
jgi:hypothetical protein